jgi:hypothetical protein
MNVLLTMELGKPSLILDIIVWSSGVEKLLRIACRLRAGEF